MEPGLFRRRQLPHWDVPDTAIFITGCLEGSISATGLSRIRSHRDALDSVSKPEAFDEQEWAHCKSKLLFKFVDDLLDHDAPVNSLTDSTQAEIVQDAFLHFADQRYWLLAFVVMPSHHHWLFLPKESWVESLVTSHRERGESAPTPRESISHSIQSYTANLCNRVRGTQGNYWQHETYDHWVRDEQELIRIIEYIEDNPVKANLAARREDWEFSSARLRHELGIELGDSIPNVG